MKKFAFTFSAALLLLSAAAAQTASGPAPAPPAPVANAVAQNSAFGLLKLPLSSEPSTQKAQQLLEQMVQALGGEAYLNMQDMEQTGRTYSFYHGESTGTGVLYRRLWKWPGKERMELTKQRDWYIIYNGENGYDVTFRGTAALEDAALADYLRRREHSLAVVLRIWLHSPGVVTLFVGEALAERRQTEQVSLLTAQNDSVSIYIDSDSHLPRRVSFIWRDDKTRDRTEEAEGYDNYRPVQGVLTPLSITRYRDGDIVNQRFITDTKYNQNLPDSLFAAAVTWDPKHPASAKRK